MPKLKSLFIALSLLILLPAGSALADDPTIIWWAEYFDNPTLKGYPVRAIREAVINHDWGFNAPLEGVPADEFSVRWTTTTDLEGGKYTFSVTVDDGVRVWVDGKLLIDEWRIQSVTTFTAAKTLAGGSHTVQMAYFDRSGAAVAKLWWRQDPPEVPDDEDDPTPDKPAGKKLIIDNRDPGFVWGGPGRYRHVARGGHGRDFFWTKNTLFSPVNYGKWIPTFARGGRYEVFVFVPRHHATTTQVRYRVLHDGRRHDRIVDQGWYSAEWVSLGTYHFNGKNKGKEFILAYDNTRERAYSTKIAFDALVLVPAKD